MALGLTGIIKDKEYGPNGLSLPLSNGVKEFVLYDNDGNKKTLKILDHPIKELHAQSLIENTAFLCSWFPTQVDTIRMVKGKEIKKREWLDVAYFVVNDGNTKRILAIDDPFIVENFKVSVLPVWENRWLYKSFVEWFEQPKQNPADAYILLKDIVKKYLDMDDEAICDVFCLWICGTFFYTLFDAFPYLDFTGTKRSGKTKALYIIKLVAFNAIMSPDFTGASIFRLIEGTGGTLCLDEAESFKREKSENAQHVRTLIMQGYLNDQSVPRTDKDTRKIEFFKLFGPKGLAHINAFDDVLEDRCIQLLLKRSTNRDLLNANPTAKAFEKIRDLLYRLFLDYAIDVETWKQKASEHIPVFGRERQLWLPLFTLAYFFNSFDVKGVVDSVLEYSTRSHKERQLTDEEESLDYRIAKFLETRINLDEWQTTNDIHKSLMTEEYKEQYQIYDKFTQNKLSHVLKRLGLKKEHKMKGSSWYITKSEVIKVHQRLGIIEYSPKQEKLSELSSHEQITHDSSNDSSMTPQEKLSFGDLVPKNDRNDSYDRNDSLGSEGVEQKTTQTSHENDSMTDHDSSNKNQSVINCHIERPELVYPNNAKSFFCNTHNIGQFGINDTTKEGSRILDFHLENHCQLQYFDEFGEIDTES